MSPSVLHLRLTNRMDSVFRVSAIVSLTAWHCVGVQQPAVCMRASGRQQECVSPVMNGAPATEARGRAASEGAHLHRGAHLPPGKFRLLHEGSRTPGRGPARAMAFPRGPPACGAECDKRRAASGCVILLELPL